MSVSPFQNGADRTAESWLNIADLMSGLMLVFMGISIFFMMNIQKQVGAEYQEIRSNIYDELEDEFANKLPVWGAHINSEKLSIQFIDNQCATKESQYKNYAQRVFFKQTSAELTEHGKQTLEDFFPAYMEVISSSKYKEHILEIRIEGHTSSEWSEDATEDEGYFENLRLSQERARAVTQYIWEIKKSKKRLRVLQKNWDWLKGRMTANGLSSSQPILYPDGTENASCSRRVEFRLVTGSEIQLEENLVQN